MRTLAKSAFEPMVTLKTIAEKAGVSVHAVSRVLNGQNKENRPSAIARAEKIRTIARELGYRPNAAAQAMKQGAFKSIMLLMSHDVHTAFLSNTTMVSMQEMLNSYGYRLMFTILPPRMEAETEFPRFFQENYVDGIVISFVKAVPDWLGELLDNMHVPKVWLGSKKEFNCVRHDDLKSARQGTERLIMRGHHRIVYVDLIMANHHLDRGHFSNFDRETGYRQAMEEANLTPVVIRPDEYVDEGNLTHYVDEAVLSRHEPTAVICYGMHSGKALLYACARRRISIPDELSMLTWLHHETFENDMLVSGFMPSNQNIGKLAAKAICEQIEQKETRRPTIVVPFAFCEGDTFGDVPSRL